MLECALNVTLQGHGGGQGKDRPTRHHEFLEFSVGDNLGGAVALSDPLDEVRTDRTISTDSYWR